MGDPSSWTTVADDNLLAHATCGTRTLARARVSIESDLAMVDSGLACDTFNFICRARLTSATAETRIRQALDFFGVTGNPFSWWLTPGYSPVELPRQLEAAGLQSAESELAMALPLNNLKVPSKPAELEIRRVRTRTDLDHYARLSASNWTPPDQHLLEYFKLTAEEFLNPAVEEWLYLGLVDGEPVATADLTIGGGVVGLYNISTQPAWRGRGIGSAMTAAPLIDARSAGHGTAILQASSDGAPIYQRLGFQAFGEITEWKL